MSVSMNYPSPLSLPLFHVLLYSIYLLLCRHNKNKFSFGIFFLLLFIADVVIQKYTKAHHTRKIPQLKMLSWSDLFYDGHIQNIVDQKYPQNTQYTSRSLSFSSFFSHTFAISCEKNQRVENALQAKWRNVVRCAH